VSCALWTAEPLAVDIALGSAIRDMFDDSDHAAEHRKALESDRQLLRTSRWLARSALARRAGLPGHELLLQRDGSGRPYVAGPDGATDIAYSVSHTDGMIAVLEGDHGSVGVDVERVDPTVNVAELARIVLVPAEQDALIAHPPADRVLPFFRTWVVKEAVLKALGTGFRVDPTNVVVDLDADQVRIALVARAFGAVGLRLPRDWLITVVDLGPQHIVATALPWDGHGAPPSLVTGDWRTLVSVDR
jgi:4'-phosphopantetheinyl transferase